MASTNIICDNCDNEFTLKSRAIDPIQYCPYCGDELHIDIDEREEIEIDEDW